MKTTAPTHAEVKVLLADIPPGLDPHQKRWVQWACRLLTDFAAHRAEVPREPTARCENVDIHGQRCTLPAGHEGNHRRGQPRSTPAIDTPPMLGSGCGERPAPVPSGVGGGAGTRYTERLCMAGDGPPEFAPATGTLSAEDAERCKKLRARAVWLDVRAEQMVSCGEMERPRPDAVLLDCAARIEQLGACEMAAIRHMARADRAEARAEAMAMALREILRRYRAEIAGDVAARADAALAAERKEET